jgi:hypothetical protein
MPSIARVLALSTALVACAGCSQGWTKPGFSEQEFSVDRLSCEQDALKMYPVVHESGVHYRPPPPSRLDTNCVPQSGFNNCDSPGSAGAPNGGPQSDANEYNRDAAVKACLGGKGYTYGKVSR